MKSINSKPRTTTSPKSKKNAGREREKDKVERRKSENHISPGVSTGKMEPSQFLAFLMGETSQTKQYARLSQETVLNYADQSIFEHPPHEISYSLAEDLSYKLRHLIHDAQVKANLSGRTALLGSDIEASMESLMVDKVYGASNSYNFMPLTDKHLYLDDTIVNLVEIAEETPTVLQPGSVTLTKQSYPDATPNMHNYVTYFDTMCRALIGNTPNLQQEALRDIRRNAHIGPIVNWFYHFGYFLLSKDITYVSLTLSALHLIAALESNTMAIQIVGARELKLLLRLILQRLLRTHTSYEVMQPMCDVLATLCRRAPLRELVLHKLAQRQQEFQVEYALPLICILNALGVDALASFMDHLFNLYLANLYLAQSESADNLHAITSVLIKSYQILHQHDAATIHQQWSFYEMFDYKLVPYWRNRCGCTEEKFESNWRNIKAQLLKNRRKIFPQLKLTNSCIELKDVFEVIVKRKPYIRLRSLQPEMATANGQTFNRQEFITIGRWSMLSDKPMKKVRSCVDYSLMIL